MRDKRPRALVAEAEALAQLRPDRVSAWTLVGAFFVLNFSFVLLETLATPLSMDQFAWGKAPALRYMGALMSAGAVVACLTFALIAPLTRVFQERCVRLPHESAGCRLSVSTTKS